MGGEVNFETSEVGDQHVLDGSRADFDTDRIVTNQDYEAMKNRNKEVSPGEKSLIPRWFPLGPTFHGGKHSAQDIRAEDFKKLLHDHKKLDREHKTLLKYCKELEQNNGQLQKEKNAANRHLNELNAERDELTERLTKLRQMLVHAPSNSVSDSAVVQQFTILRSQILGLVRQTWNVKVKEGINPSTLSEAQRNFFYGLCTGNCINWKCPYERLRFAVFSLLNSIIFSCRPYFLHPYHKKLEDLLRNVESAMWVSCTSEAGRGSLIEWRNVTMKAMESLRDDSQSLSLLAQDRIWTFFQVLELRAPGTEQKGKEKLQKICDQAVELSLMMRNARDEISIYFANSHGIPASEWEHLIDEGTAVPADSTHQSGHIAYLYAGALVKYTKEKPNDMQVLERAEAVVYSA